MVVIWSTSFRLCVQTLVPSYYFSSRVSQSVPFISNFNLNVLVAVQGTAPSAISRCGDSNALPLLQRRLSSKLEFKDVA
jgi:hypothetical protein